MGLTLEAIPANHSRTVKTSTVPPSDTDHFWTIFDQNVQATRDVVRPNVAGPVESGASWVRIDEPAAPTRLEEVPLGLRVSFSAHRHAARVLGPERIEVNTDCGLRTRTWEVSYEKPKNMV